jgi:hypothetical protein
MERAGFGRDGGTRACERSGCEDREKQSEDCLHGDAPSLWLGLVHAVLLLVVEEICVRWFRSPGSDRRAHNLVG